MVNVAYVMVNALPTSAHADADKEVLCKMFFVGIHWLNEPFPTNEDLAQCINDPAGWRDAYLGQHGGSSGAIGPRE